MIGWADGPSSISTPVMDDSLWKARDSGRRQQTGGDGADKGPKVYL